MDCRSRIVFIGTEGELDLEPMIPYIQRLSRKVPVDALAFELIKPAVPSTLDQRTVELEDLIARYAQEGYTHIGLPSDPNLVRASVLGTGGELNNVPIDWRWPHLQFMVQDPGIVAVDYPKNIYRFGDVNTLVDTGLVKYNLNRYIREGGRAYVLFQGAGDAVSTELTNLVFRNLREMGVTTTAYQIGNPDGSFNEAEIRRAVDSFLETIPPRPAQSVLIHIVNWLNAEAYTRAGIKAGAFSDFGGRVVHYSFGNEYNPSETPLPVRLELGRIPLEGLPSMDAASIGIPLEPAAYYSFPYLLTYLDSYLWAATCGRTDGINDKQLKFDQQGTRTSYYLADMFFPPMSLGLRVGPSYLNPRWWNPSLPVVDASKILPQ